MTIEDTACEQAELMEEATKSKYEDDLIVKSNRLINAIQNLSLAETRLIQLAVISARHQGGLAYNVPLFVSTSDFAEAFNLSKNTAYKSLQEAEENLFKRHFRFLEDGEQVKSQWVTRVKYKLEDIGIEITLAPDVINEITNIDGYDNFFTSYRQGQTKEFNSIYSYRIFELVKSWENIGKTPVFDIKVFREQLGIKDHEYPHMSNFKKRVIDVAIKEINEKTTYNIEYFQHKAGVKIKGFSFKIENLEPKPKLEKRYKRQQITIAEAIEISQSLKGGYINETERDAIKRVMEHKDENGNSVYYIKATKEDWEQHRANKRALSDKVEHKAQDHKWEKVGNTVIDDRLIDRLIVKGETRVQAKERIKRELEAQLQLSLVNSLDDDRPLSEILGLKSDKT